MTFHCIQGASSPDSSTVYVDMRALRNDRVTLVEKGAPHSLCLMESGKVKPLYSCLHSSFHCLTY